MALELQGVCIYIRPRRGWMNMYQLFRGNTISLDRISVRSGAVIAIVAMGALAFAMAVVSGRIYRDHALDNERVALTEKVRIGVEIMHRRIDSVVDETS